VLTARDLAAMRTTQAEAQPETATIHRSSDVSDGRGGQTTTWTADTATITARIGYLTAAEQTTANALGLERAVVLSLPVGTDVAETDRVIIGTRTYQVAGPLKGSYQTALRVMATDIGDA